MRNNTINKLCIIICLCLCSVFQAMAQTKQEADEAYAKEQYQKASQIYSKLLQENGKSAILYFNLGDCYYRMNDMPKAVLNYQRARQLEPGNSKIRHNLKLAQGQLADQFVPQSEMFFVTWTKAWMDTRTSDGWASCAIVMFVLLLAGIAVYLFCNKIWLRKVGFFGALLCLLLCVLFNIFGHYQKNKVTETPQAVVMAPVVEVKSTPASMSAKQFELHEGTTVTITDNSMQDWKGIELEDGRTGWVRAEQLEII